MPFPLFGSDEDVWVNIRNGEKLVREAAAKGAQIILLQELLVAPTSARQASPTAEKQKLPMINADLVFCLLYRRSTTDTLAGPAKWRIVRLSTTSRVSQRSSKW